MQTKPIVFRRSQNVLLNFWRFTKNSFKVSNKIELTPSLIFLFSVLVGVIGFAFWYTWPYMFYASFLFPLFSASEIVAFFIVSKRASFFKIKSIEIRGETIVANYPELEKIINIRDVTKISYSGFYLDVATGIFFHIASLGVRYRKHFVVHSRNGEKLLIPLDLPHIAKFIKIIAQRADLGKEIPYELSLLYEWTKKGDKAPTSPRDKAPASPHVLDPNADITGALLIAIVLVIIIYYILNKTIWR